MKKLLQNHLELVKYVLKELKVKRTPKQAVEFFKTLGKSYYKVMLQEYKNLFMLFDKDYKKEKIKFKKYQQYQKDLRNAYRIIQYMVKMGDDRQNRKNIRRDFEKYGIINKETEKKILDELYNYKE